MTIMSIKCRFCGALISGDFTKGDTFPARNIDNKSGKELEETFPICKDCYYETRGAEQEKEHKEKRQR
jgi:hypothetical protein